MASRQGARRLDDIKLLRALRLVFANGVVLGTLLILLFSGGFSFFILLLSWIVYRDRYGITLLEYFQFLF